MANKLISPIVLAILDGWGHSNRIKGNAIKLAYTPTIDKLWKNNPNCLLNASGTDVGLPDKQMGNSEVGHTTIGAGRNIYQDLVRISQSIEDKTFFNNPIIHQIFDKANTNKNSVHLIGLCSNGGVHSHISHLIELIKIAQIYTNVTTCIHVITDGRDTKTNTAKRFIQAILDHIINYDHINICTISGRYYSMDRDCRWSRTEKAYHVLVKNIINDITNPLEVIDFNYKQNISDEFITPTRIHKGNIKDGDSIIYFNFRPDRMRQILHAFVKSSFKGFSIDSINNLDCLTFTQYDPTLKLPILFPPEQKKLFLGEIISNNNLKQFRLAETEKYAHVTYFLNGGREEPFPGEDRELIPSPKVNTYDLTPEMSAYNLTESIIKALKENTYHLIIINYANTDMVGHTGDLNATIEAASIVDKCINQLTQEIERIQGTLIITADHGNAEYMLDHNNQPCTSHSTNLVPFICVSHEQELKQRLYSDSHLRKIGSLADIAPTILDILNIDIPKEMNGQSLINTSINTIKSNAISTH